MIDATALNLIDLPLIRYTIHPWGQLQDAWPEELNLRLLSLEVVTGWEVWCEATDMRRSR